MQQLTLVGARKLEWRHVPDPVISGPKAALVRPVAVGVCDFDRGLVSGRYAALPYPIPLGHEVVAEVIAVGREVRDIQPGMQVVLPLHISCGSCASCNLGHTDSCTSRSPLSNYGLGARGGDWGAGMSDIMLVPYADAMAVPVPRGLTAVDCAAIGCNLVDMFRTIAPHVGKFPDPRVLIVGGHAHNMALYGIAMARALGVEKIDFLDDDLDRLAAAEALGARSIALSGASGLYPIVVDCSGDPKRFAMALSRVGPNGVCTSVWPYVGSFELPIGAMFMRNATLVTGQPARANSLRAGVEAHAAPQSKLNFYPVRSLALGKCRPRVRAGRNQTDICATIERRFGSAFGDDRTRIEINERTGRLVDRRIRGDACAGMGPVELSDLRGWSQFNAF